ncbi:MAG: hypothetical protein LQ340_003885 [Diploschistes diacapsis]|nr:MAG: hypothetical protein LQ340_003885 [Diploschistes diacapsis]
MGILPRSSYYTKDYRQTAALIRARQPYLIKNIFTGLGLFAFAMSIYSFTFYAVKQDDFSDVKVPEGPAAAAAPVQTAPQTMSQGSVPDPRK